MRRKQTRHVPSIQRVGFNFYTDGARLNRGGALHERGVRAYIDTLSRRERQSRYSGGAPMSCGNDLNDTSRDFDKVFLFASELF